MKRFLTLIVILLSLVSCSMDENDDLFIVEGALRNSGTGWFIIDDSAHEPYGMKSVAADSEKITIFYTKTVDKVISLQVTTDETFAQLGYFVGASVGREKSYLYVYKDIAGDITLIDPLTIVSEHGNFWIYGQFED